MKHIAFAKVGKSIRFDYKGDSSGGECEPPLLLQALANNNPDKTFYIVGRSDYSRLDSSTKLDLFPYGNVVDVWENAIKFTDRKDHKDPFFNHVTNYFKQNDIAIDFGIMMPGQIGTVTIPGIIQQVRDPSLIASVIDMTLNYTTPVIMWLNDTKIPYVEVITDPRYVMNQSRDMIHAPSIALSQYDYEYTRSVIKSYEEQVRVESNVKVTYAGIETIFCYGKQILPLQQKSVGMLIGLNEGDPSRYPMLKEWILDRMDNVDVYGVWSDEIKSKDSRFKGSIPLQTLQDKLNYAKYTFAIPIREGWVTSKYIEMIHAGCIPFFHPTYDMQRHLKVPEILRPKTPEDLGKTIAVLERNDNLRLELIQKLQHTILENKFYTGEHLSDTILSAGASIIGEQYTKTDVSKFKPVEKFSLDSFFG